MNYWQTIDGKRIAIVDLTNDHLRSIIKMLTKQGVAAKEEKLIRLMERLDRCRGDKALKDVTDEIDRIEALPLAEFTRYSSIFNEAARRKLKSVTPMEELCEIMEVPVPKELVAHESS